MAASTEIWKCDICDRMMFFDGPSAPVPRYMRRIDAESLGKNELAREHKNGTRFNNLLFNEVDWFADSKHERSGEPDYEILGNPGESLEAIQPGLAERGIMTRTGPLYGRANLTEQRTTSHSDTRSSLCFALFYCSLFAIAWSISLSSAARCSAELMAPTIGSPTMLPF